MIKILTLISGVLVTIGLLLAGFQVDIKSQVEDVFGATQVVDNANCKTASATSTLTYMTPGTATTTVTCVIGQDAARSAVLVIEVNASSTKTGFTGAVEESMDGQDWFPITLNQIASTTNPFTLTTRGTFQFDFASTTIGSGAVGVSSNRLGFNETDNRNHYSIEVPVRMKRVRAYVGLATDFNDGNATSTNGAVWMQIIPKVEF